MGNPRISIITVVYNGAKYLETTIKKILDQTSKDFEYIIIDGGSTDKTIDIIKKYEKEIDYWISEPDNGLYDAMNKGLKVAKGDFVWFINAGDTIYDENTLKNLVDLSHDEQPDILYGETLIIGDNDKEIGMRRQPAPENLTWKDLKRGMVVCHQSFIPRHSLAPLFDLKYKHSADIDWEFKCLRKAERIVNANQIISRFLDGGQSKSNIVPSLKERFAIMRKNYGLLPTLWYHIPIVLRFLSFYFRNRRF